jgi:hypothetical protein
MEAARVDRTDRPARPRRPGEDEAAERLAEALEGERDRTAALLAALEAEHKSLMAGRVEELYAACRQRAEVIETVRESQQATARVIRELSKGEPLGLTQAIARLSRRARPRLRALRLEVNQLRRHVSALSEENRASAQAALDYLDQAVAILTGAEAAQSQAYGENRLKSLPAHVSSEV